MKFLLQRHSPSLRDAGSLTLATVRAFCVVSGRDDLALPTAFKGLRRSRPVTPGLTQIVVTEKIQEQGAIEIKEAIKWLRHENGKGAHIYIRPAGAHCLSLIDDLTAEAMERMKADGFEPAVVVETSPNNFQTW
jgi:hypothetical protein